jgi:hypothetical protein
MSKHSLLKHARALVAPTDKSQRQAASDLSRVGQNHIFIRIYGINTVFLAGKSPYIRLYTVCIYGSGQP